MSDGRIWCDCSKVRVLPCNCDCMGGGEEWPECPTCNGRGTVNPLTAPKGFFCVSTTDCPSCDGTGEMQ